MSKTRKYNCSDVDMLMASRTIASSFKEHISDLSALRPGWTEPYAVDLIARIDKALTSSLGTDVRKGLRLATLDLISIQEQAKRDVIFLRREIVTIFSRNRPRRDEILRELGYPQYKDSLYTKHQQGMINLLTAIRENLTPGLRNELIEKGVSPALLDRVAQHADTFSKANSTQETLKTSSLTVTKALAEEFNDLFDEIRGVCRIASYFYQSDRPFKAAFTFSKVLDNLGAPRKETVEVPLVN